MPKKTIVTVGYRHYAVSNKDALLLIQIADRAQHVETQDFRRCTVHEDQEAFVYVNGIADVMPRPDLVPESHRITHQKRVPKSHRLTHDKMEG